MMHIHGYQLILLWDYVLLLLKRAHISKISSFSLFSLKLNLLRNFKLPGVYNSKFFQEMTLETRVCSQSKLLWHFIALKVPFKTSLMLNQFRVSVIFFRAVNMSSFEPNEEHVSSVLSLCNQRKTRVKSSDTCGNLRWQCPNARWHERQRIPRSTEKFWRRRIAKIVG